MNTKFNVDWQLLYGEWVKSGLSRDDFLIAKGINPKGMVAKKQTRNWGYDTQNAAANIKREKNNVEFKEAEKFADGDSTINEEQEYEIKRLPRPEIAIKEIWKIVAQWRQRQAENDYRLADIIRLHCKIILKNRLQMSVDLNGEKTYKSNINARELLSIAKVAETVQRMQRLALGLSTENVGVETNMKESSEGDIPVFEVQVNQNGKFVRVR